MKKLAMMTVKGAIGLLPSSVKSKLKNNHKLTEFYSRSLQRSGLFYGFPSKKKRRALYAHYLKQQQKQLEQLGVAGIDTNSVAVVIVGERGAAQSIASLNKAGISKKHIHIVGKEKQSGAIKLAASLDEVVKAVSGYTYLLAINSGDTLLPDMVSVFLKWNTQASMIYCDTDKFDKKGNRKSPHFLPDWNPELQFSSAYISTGVLFSVRALEQVDYKAATIAGMACALWLSDTAKPVAHIPLTLLHRSSNNKTGADELEDIADVLQHYTHAVSAYNREFGIQHIQWPILDEPLVSLIIPTKNAKALVQACINSILEKTTYKNYEILLIDNGSDERESIAYFQQLTEHPKIRVLEYPGPFNYSAINNFGVQHAKGDIVGLVNNDIEVIKPDWLTFMVGHASRHDVGCVGAKLLYSDDRVQHAGVVLGYGGGAGHAHKYFPRYHPGYLKRLVATQNYSAVTAACLLVKKSLFNAVGGLNEKDLTVAFNDVDFCLRVRECGVRNVYCAEAELYHHESVSRGLDLSPEKAARFKKELDYLQTHWAHYIAHDPAYSPNLTLKRENFSVKTKEEFAALRK